jgi:hypothetical protein
MTPLRYISPQEQVDSQLPLLDLFPRERETSWGEFTIAGRTWRTSPVFNTYWHFAVERQNIFFRRLSGDKIATEDPILKSFRFTNVYRASDRVSQYLIRNVAYQGPQTPEEIFFRIILFKLFNKIETWELLQSRLNELTWKHANLEGISAVLNEAFHQGTRIYSAAYIMPSGGKSFARKHDAHLNLLASMMNDEVPRRISGLPSMSAAFSLLRSYPMLGDFLAYQFVIDLNYSTLSNFTESEFVVAGPGARDGIRKCFPDLPLSMASDAIQAVFLSQSREFSRRNLEFRTLSGRELQLIDCQNLFCEVDKYSRVAHPEIAGLSSRTRIKQVFRPSGALPAPYYPPKWGITLAPDYEHQDGSR